MNNMKTYSIAVLLLLVGVMFTACDSYQATVNQQQYEAKQGVSDVTLGASWSAEAKATEKNQQTLIASTPIPYLDNSLERQNIARRLNLLNEQNKMFYVYLVNYGKVMAFYTAKGKVSALDSQITTPQQIVASSECLSHSYSGTATNCYQVVDSPQQDGSYGTNGEGIYFFTTEGAYVEWRGDYMVADQPLKLVTPPEMIQQVTS